MKASFEDRDPPEAKAWVLDAFEADHACLGLAIPYRVLIHNGDPAQADERSFLLPLWCLT